MKKWLVIDQNKCWGQKGTYFLAKNMSKREERGFRFPCNLWYDFCFYIFFSFFKCYIPGIMHYALLYLSFVTHHSYSFTFYLVLWKFYISFYYIHYLSHLFTDLPPFSILFHPFIKNIQDQLVVSKYSWIWGLPLESGWLSRAYTLRVKMLLTAPNNCQYCHCLGVD